MGKPLEKYQYWLGEVFPNEEQTSAETTRVLLNDARRKKMLDQEKKLQLVAIGAEKDSHPNDERMRGLLDVINSSEDVILHQITYSNWDNEKARFAF